MRKATTSHLGGFFVVNMKQKNIITITTEAHVIDGNSFLLFKDTQGLFIKDRLMRITFERVLLTQLRMYGLDTVIILTESTQGKPLSKMLVLEQNNTYSTFCGNAAKLIGTFLPKDGVAKLETITNQKVDIRKSSHVEVVLPIKHLTLSLRQKNVICKQFALVGEIVNMQAFTAAGEPHLTLHMPLSKMINFVALKQACLSIQEAFALIGGINVCLVRDVRKPLVTVFERGVNNFTQSCGTGAASVTASLGTSVTKIHFVHPTGKQHLNVRKDSAQKVRLLGKGKSTALFTQQLHLTDSGMTHMGKQYEEVIL